MSTTDQAARIDLPCLVEGEQLDRATFHERYAAMPEETRAELIAGVVYMAFGLGLDHGDSDDSAGYWLGHYSSFTPGTRASANASVFLSDDDEVQPDQSLRILPSHGGSTIRVGKFCAGAPELIVEVSDSTLSIDLGPKLVSYERAGVPEYIILGVDPPAVRWHKLIGGRLVEVEPDADGIYRSTVFRGLWLDPVALLGGDLRRLREVVDLGVATDDHAAFARRLAEAGGADRG